MACDDADVTPLDAHKRLIRDMIDAVWVRRDLDALATYWAPDCVNHAAPGDPVGLLELRRYHEGFTEQLTAYTDVEIRVLRQIAEEDSVVTHLVTTARTHTEFAGAARADVGFTLSTIRIDRIADDRIVEHWSVAALAQDAALPVRSAETR